MKPRPCTGLHCVCDPHGNLVFTTLYLEEKHCIEEWLKQQLVVEEISNLGRTMRGEAKTCCPSWEQFEADGYRIVPVVLMPADIEPEKDRVSK